MKALLWYCKELFIGNIKPIKNSENVHDKNIENITQNEVIVPWITIESESDYNYFKDILQDLKKMSKQFKTNQIVVIPFAHFSNKLPPYSTSFRIMTDLENYLKQNGFETKRAHFGSAKDLKFFSPANSHQVVFRSYPRPGYLK